MSTTRRAVRRAGVAVIAAAALTGAATASAASVVAVTATPSGQAATPADVIVAVGTGQATPKPADAHSNSSIVAAVAKARALAIPRAITNAQVQAAAIAQASGLTLGPVVSVSQDTTNGFYGFYYSQLTARLGPNRYCGQVTRSRVRHVKGKRVVLRRSAKECAVPPFVTTTLAVTFSASRP